MEQSALDKLKSDIETLINNAEEAGLSPRLIVAGMINGEDEAGMFSMIHPSELDFKMTVGKMLNEVKHNFPEELHANLNIYGIASNLIIPIVPEVITDMVKTFIESIIKAHELDPKLKVPIDTYEQVINVTKLAIDITVIGDKFIEKHKKQVLSDNLNEN